MCVEACTMQVLLERQDPVAYLRLDGKSRKSGTCTHHSDGCSLLVMGKRCIEAEKKMIRSAGDVCTSCLLAGRDA